MGSDFPGANSGQPGSDVSAGEAARCSNTIYLIKLEWKLNRATAALERRTCFLALSSRCLVFQTPVIPVRCGACGTCRLSKPKSCREAHADGLWHGIMMLLTVS
jgi:hypothetical protein